MISPCTAFTSRPTRRATARIDTRPAPHRALSNSQRLGVSTLQSNSGEAKAICASFSARFDFRALAASASVSFRLRTSRTTVFTTPPFYIRKEVGHELVGIDERISAL